MDRPTRQNSFSCLLSPGPPVPPSLALEGGQVQQWVYGILQGGWLFLPMPGAHSPRCPHLQDRISSRLSRGPLGPSAEGRPALPRYDRYAWDEGAGGVLEDQRVNPVCALQQQRVLIELYQLAAQLDAADQVNRHRPIQHVGQERRL